MTDAGFYRRHRANDVRFMEKITRKNHLDAGSGMVYVGGNVNAICRIEEFGEGGMLALERGLRRIEIWGTSFKTSLAVAT